MYLYIFISNSYNNIIDYDIKYLIFKLKCINIGIFKTLRSSRSLNNIVIRKGENIE